MNNASNSNFIILCVDDEPGIREILSEKIKDWGFEAMTAANPKEGLEILSIHSQRIALVISDFKMPEMNGLEFRKAMLAEWKDIPFIIASGHVSREDALKGIEYKIAGFVPKPFQDEQLKNLILEESHDRISSLKEELELLEGFVADSESLLEELESLLLTLKEGQNHPETLNRIFAIAHTIKGASGFFKPDIVNKFTHRYEDFFSPFKKGEKDLDSSTIQTLITGYDTIKLLVQAMKKGNAREFELENLVRIFTNQGNSASRNPTAKSEMPVAVAPESGPKEEIRVSIDILNHFMELSGEITVIRNMINKLVRVIEKEAAGNKNVSHLSELLDEMHRINHHLQDKIVELRKVPVRNVFRPLTRTVRDIASTLKKDIQVQFQNDSLKIDTTLAEVLSNSLVHMVRNSADHGIESPEIRKKSSKEEKGTILISARQTHEEVIIEVSDDGKGLDTEFLRKKIVEKGLCTAEQAKNMSVDTVNGMIFESGFSTAAKVTDVSGRGVGMDMVKKSVTKIGGKIVIDSQLGKGTKFFLHLPIPKSVTIIGSVLVKAGEETFAIPQDSIIRLIRFDDENSNLKIMSLEGADCLMLEDQIYPYLDLRTSLSNNAQVRTQAQKYHSHTLAIVLVKSETAEYAIGVDSILDLEDVVVKKLGPHLSHRKEFLGATFVGDGGVTLIVDTHGLGDLYGIQMSSNKDRESARQDIASQSLLETREYLLFQLNSPGIFAVPLSSVFRLEQIEKRKIQWSGEQAVTLYRDGILPIYCLDQILNQTETSVLNHSSETSIYALVVRTEKGYVGFGVFQIVDLVQCKTDIDTAFASNRGAMGAAIIQNQTVTVVDLQAAQLAQEPNFEDNHNSNEIEAHRDSEGEAA